MTPVLLCGEGRNELGGRAGHPSYQHDRYPGFIEASLERVAPGRALIRGALQWKSLPILRVGGRGDPFARRTTAALQRARELDARLCLLVDRDKNSNVETSIRRAAAEFAAGRPGDEAALGVPAPKLEGWILALLGQSRTEAMTPAGAEARLAERGVAAKDTAAFVSAVSSCDLACLPEDAVGLRRWFDDLSRVLAAP